MKHSFIPAALFLLSSAVLNEVSATCHTYYYQREDYYDVGFVMYSYDHDDGSCSTRNDRQKLAVEDWVSIKANKNHQDTIQIEWNYVDTTWESTLGYTTDQPMAFRLCDDITQKSKCSGSDAYKSHCNGRYVFYPPDDDNDYPRICKAVLDDDDNPILDSSGRPYGECNGSCPLQDQETQTPMKRSRRKLETALDSTNRNRRGLRGGKASAKKKVRKESTMNNQRGPY